MLNYLPSPFMVAPQIPFPRYPPSPSPPSPSPLPLFSSFDAASILVSLKSDRNRNKDGKGNKRKAHESVDDQVNETLTSVKAVKKVKTAKTVRAVKRVRADKAAKTVKAAKTIKLTLEPVAETMNEPVNGPSSEKSEQNQKGLDESQKKSSIHFDLPLETVNKFSMEFYRCVGRFLYRNKEMMAKLWQLWKNQQINPSYSPIIFTTESQESTYRKLLDAVALYLSIATVCYGSHDSNNNKNRDCVSHNVLNGVSQEDFYAFFTPEVRAFCAFVAQNLMNGRLLSLKPSLKPKPGLKTSSVNVPTVPPTPVLTDKKGNQENEFMIQMVNPRLVKVPIWTYEEVMPGSAITLEGIHRAWLLFKRNPIPKKDSIKYNTPFDRGMGSDYTSRAMGFFTSRKNYIVWTGEDARFDEEGHCVLTDMMFTFVQKYIYDCYMVLRTRLTPMMSIAEHLYRDRKAILALWKFLERTDGEDKKEMPDLPRIPLLRKEKRLFKAIETDVYKFFKYSAIKMKASRGEIVTMSERSEDYRVQFSPRMLAFGRYLSYVLWMNCMFANKDFSREE